MRRRKAEAFQIGGDRQERPAVLVLGRRVHQHRGASTVDHAEIASERRITGQRQDRGSSPSGAGEKIWSGGRRNHCGGHRPPQAGGTSAVKRRASPPAPSIRMTSAFGHNQPPSRSGHSISNAPPMSASSSPSSSTSPGPERR